jgi:hypothetical protein
MIRLKRYYYTVVVYILTLWRNYCSKKYSKLLIKLRTEKNKYPSINEYHELDKNSKLAYYWFESWRVYRLISYYEQLAAKPIIYETIIID